MPHSTMQCPLNLTARSVKLITIVCRLQILSRSQQKKNYCALARSYMYVASYPWQASRGRKGTRLVLMLQAIKYIVVADLMATGILTELITRSGSP